MLQRICFIVNYNAYESKRHFTRKLAEAFQRKSIDTHIIDVEEKSLSGREIQGIKLFDPDFTCSFNNLLPIKETTFLWDVIEIPHLSFLVDPALYSVELTNSPYSLISCVDRNDVQALQMYQFPDAFFLPHAVEPELAPDPHIKKEYDVVFFGTCYDYENLRTHWKSELPKDVCAVLDDAIDSMDADNTLSLSQALVNAWNSKGTPTEKVDFLKLYHYLDYYTRGKDRVSLIRSIKETPIHIFGERFRDTPDALLGWPQMLKNQKNVTIHPPVNFDKVAPILQRSKLTLNSMPFFRDGTHERVFMGLALGALPLTSESLFLKEAFADKESLLYYDSKNFDAINALVQEYVHDDKKRDAVLSRGRELVMKNHTWDSRVEQLCACLPPLLAARKQYHK